jgi:hypothetical protein
LMTRLKREKLVAMCLRYMGLLPLGC